MTNIREVYKVFAPISGRVDRSVLEVGDPVVRGETVIALIQPEDPPFLNQRTRRELEAAADAGASWAGYILVRLPLEIKELFDGWLDRHVPLKKQRVLNLIRSTRGGKLYESQFGTRMRGTGAYADLLRRRFEVATRRLGLDGPRPELDTSRFRVPPRAGDQLSLL